MAKTKPAPAPAPVSAPAAPAPVAPVNLELLAAIAAASVVAPFYMQAPIEVLEPMRALGYVEVNPDPQYAKDQNPAFPAARIMPPGSTFLASQAPVGAAATPFGQPPVGAAPAPAPAPAAAPATPTAMSSIISFTMPEPKRVGGTGGARPEKFPFSKLEIGQAFFVPATAAVTNPVKKYASTVASATSRYSVEDKTKAPVQNRKGRMAPVMIVQRKFVIRAVADGKDFGFPGVAGAAIGRLPL